MDRGAWQTTLHGVSKSQTQLSEHEHKTRNAFGHWLRLARKWNFNPTTIRN